MPLHRSTNPPPAVRRRRCLRLLLCAVGLLAVLLFALLAVVLRESPSATPAPTTQDHPDGPPWRHGQADARFVLTFYADLECPFCKAYYPSRPPRNWHVWPSVRARPAGTGPSSMPSAGCTSTRAAAARGCPGGFAIQG